MFVLLHFCSCVVVFNCLTSFVPFVYLLLSGAQMSLGYSRITGATGGRGNGHHSQSLKTTSSASGNSFLSGSKDIKVMALCELIKGDKFIIKKNNDIWVVNQTIVQW